MFHIFPRVQDLTLHSNRLFLFSGENTEHTRKFVPLKILSRELSLHLSLDIGRPLFMNAELLIPIQSALVNCHGRAIFFL